MSVDQSLGSALRRGVELSPSVEKTTFGRIEFQFENFVPKLSVVDLNQPDAEDLLRYINGIRLSQLYTPLEAMIIGKNGLAKLIAVRYQLDQKEKIDIYAADSADLDTVIERNGKFAGFLTRQVAGYNLLKSSPEETTRPTKVVITAGNALSFGLSISKL